jgi:hypothetical protein
VEPLVDVDAIPRVVAVEGEPESAQRHVVAGAAAEAEEGGANAVEERIAAALPFRGIQVGGVPVA